MLTVIAAIMLSLLPLPDMIGPFKPYWVALVVIYWALETHDMIGLGGAFLAGLLLDVLSGSLMGMHALSLVIMVFLVQRFRPRLRFFPTWQYWLPPIVALAIWPWLFLLLDRVRAGTRQRSS